MAELIGGSGYDDVQDTEPTNLSIGDTWLDTSVDPPVAQIWVDLGGGGQWAKEEVAEQILTNLDATVSSRSSHTDPDPNGYIDSPISDAKPSPLPSEIESTNDIQQLNSSSLWSLFAGNTASIKEAIVYGKFDHRGVIEVRGGSDIICDGGNWQMENSANPEITFIHPGSQIVCKNGGTFDLHNQIFDFIDGSIIVDGGTMNWDISSNNTSNIITIDVVNGGALSVSGDIIEDSGGGTTHTIDSTSSLTLDGTMDVTDNNDITVDGSMTINGTYKMNKGSTASEKTTISGSGSITGNGSIGRV